MIFRLIPVLLLLLLPLTALGQSAPAPTPEEVKKVLKYYFNGSGMVYLVDIKICQSVPLERGHENRFQCQDEVKSGNVLKDEKVMIWMHFFAPRNTEKKALVIFNRGGAARATRHVTVKGSTRWPRWLPFKPNKAGNWEVQVMFDTENDTILLGRLPIQVQ